MGEAAAVAQNESRVLFRGTFTQTSPLPWSGAMEIYLKYDPEADGPQNGVGVITWRDLGSARTRLEGKLVGTELSFSETGCSESSCSQVVLGGIYEGKFNSTFDILSGSAAGRTLLQGHFTLRRVTGAD